MLSTSSSRLKVFLPQITTPLPAYGLWQPTKQSHLRFKYYSLSEVSSPGNYNTKTPETKPKTESGKQD